MDNKTNGVSSHILSEKEIRRYALQIGIPQLGIAGQEKLKLSKVLVIGAGGKGSSVLENLVTIGIGKVGISDNYPVQEAELSRQHLYGNGDLGKQKAIIARDKLLEINHLVDFQLHNVCLNQNNIEGISSSYDVLVDATGNFPAHFLISDAAVALNKPLIFGSVMHGLGYVTVFNYQNGPSLRDAFPEPYKPTGVLGQDGFSCQVTLMSMIGSIMANETVKVILGLDTPLNGSFLTVDAGSYTFKLGKFGK